MNPLPLLLYPPLLSLSLSLSLALSHSHSFSLPPPSLSQLVAKSFVDAIHLRERYQAKPTHPDPHQASQWAAAVRAAPFTFHPPPDQLADECGYSYHYTGKSGVVEVRVVGGGPDLPTAVAEFAPPTLAEFNRHVAQIWATAANKPVRLLEPSHPDPPPPHTRTHTHTHATRNTRTHARKHTHTHL
jgi:hypothetical protein